MRFRFNLDKALQVLRYFLEAGPTDKVKLMKLVYLADRTHFIAHGVPITGDRLVAMPYGPVPSATLDAVNGTLSAPRVFQVIHVNDDRVEPRGAAEVDLLSPDELATLDQVRQAHGAKATWDLVSETHRLPEYAESYVEGTSRLIPYERIAKHSGNPERFALDRPVITQTTATALECPFPVDDDL